MSEKQTKGFLTNIEEHEVYSIKDKQDTHKRIEKDESMSDFIMDIGLDKKKNEKIFLHKAGSTSRLTGNAMIDSYIKLNDYLIDHSKIKVRDIAVVFRLMATMINAGIPLIKSLNSLGVQAEKNPKLQRVLFDMANEVEAGAKLSKAMGKYPDVFTEAQRGAVQAGEASGQLNTTFKNMALEAEKSASIASKVKGALIYPVVVMVIMFGVIFLMMLVVVPQISGLYTEAGKDLPLATQVLIKMSDFTVQYWYLILASVAGLIFAILAWKKTKNGRYYWDKMLISMPVFGDLVRKSVLAKFSNSFGNLLAAGVPIISAMEIVATAVGNEVYKKRFLLAAEDMKGGIPMAENLSSSKLFPSMLVNMIEVGEQTAQLEKVTKKIAEFYNEEVDTAVSALTKVMEPLIMVVVGVTVGGLVAAVMLPILSLTNFAGNL